VKDSPNETLFVAGVKLGTANTRILETEQEDLVVVTLDAGSQVAGLFTQNSFRAPPVQIAERHLQEDSGIRALLINSGNANAATGEDGQEDVEKLCMSLAVQLGLEKSQVLPFSTGVIGERLPIQKMLDGMPQAIKALHVGNWREASYAILTTDTVPKICSRTVKVGGEEVRITGFAKGSGMIKPNMATMLAFIFCDAHIDRNVLQNLIIEVAERSFNRISVDGDTSTNDSFILCATGQARNQPVTDIQANGYSQLRNGIEDVAQELARSIVRDGEGATRFVEITVEGGRNTRECLSVSYSIANSPLVKTALFAGDPNWGRFCMAIGNAGVVDLDTSKVSLFLDEICVAQKGQKMSDYKEQDGARILSKNEYQIRIDLGRGNAVETIYSTDLSHEYIKINSEYRS